MLRRHSLLIALFACLPSLAALAVFGVLQTPDSPGYIDYAGQMLAGVVPSGAALLHESPSPISLFRSPGYPAVLAAARTLAPDAWRLLIVLVQIAAQAGLAVGAYRTALRLGARPRLAFIAALLPTLSFGVVTAIAILTDCVDAVLGAGAAFVLATGRNWRAALLTGLMLAAATMLREATPFVALTYLPLAWIAAGGGLPRRALAMALVLLPPWFAAFGLMGWNEARIGHPVLTTSRQTVMVQAVLPLLKHHLPVYAGDDLFDRTARATVGTGQYDMIDTLHRDLFAAGMTAPAIADAATARYFSAWRRFPVAMLGATIANFRYEFLALPFQPFDTVAGLMVYAHWPRPVFDRLNLLWARLVHGDVGAGFWILADVLTRLIGTVIAVAAVVLPWLPGRSWRLRGLWLVCGGFIGVYLPVHLETRYLLPVVPVACVLAAAGLEAAHRGEAASAPLFEPSRGHVPACEGADTIRNSGGNDPPSTKSPI